MDNFYKKYLKYKIKYLNLKKHGGYIKSHVSIFKIKSIGFEIETSEFAPVIIKDNIILPYGFHKTKGSVIITDISDTWTNNTLPERQILITQDDFSPDEFKDDDDFIKNIHDKLHEDIGGSITYILEKNDKNIEFKNYIISKDKDDTSIYGHTEFITTYKSVINSVNLIYEKFYEVFNLVQKFFYELKKIDKQNFYLYKHEQTGTYFLSMLSKKDFNKIEITPQTTIGIDFRNICEIITMLEEDYVTDMKQNLYKFSLEQIITDLKKIFGEQLYEQNCNYLILLYYCFLHANSIFDYYYYNASFIVGIDRNSLKIKPRHYFTNIKKYILNNYDLKNNYDKLLEFVNNENNKEIIKSYRIYHLNNLITEQINLHFDPVIAQNYNVKINNNLNKLWGDIEPADMQIIIEKFRTLKEENNIFLYKNVNEILDYIASLDEFMINNIFDTDSIISGGNLFEDCSTILLELRYISRKNPYKYDTTINTHINNMSRYINKLHVDEPEDIDLYSDGSQSDGSQFDGSQSDGSHSDESRPKRRRE